MLSLQHHRPLAPIDSLGIAHLDSLDPWTSDRMSYFTSDNLATALSACSVATLT